LSFFVKKAIAFLTKNLDLDSGKRAKDEILHFVQNDRWRASG